MRGVREATVYEVNHKSACELKPGEEGGLREEGEGRLSCVLPGFLLSCV